MRVCQPDGSSATHAQLRIVILDPILVDIELAAALDALTDDQLQRTEMGR
jgi:hypothetical protein